MSAHFTSVLFITCLASCSSLLRLTADPNPVSSPASCCGWVREERRGREGRRGERGEEGERGSVVVPYVGAVGLTISALNFVRCSKCCAISVAKTMSIIDALISLYVALWREEGRGRGEGEKMVSR